MVPGCEICNKWGHLLQPVTFGSRALKIGGMNYFTGIIASVRQHLPNKHNEYSQVLDSAVHLLSKDKNETFYVGPDLDTICLTL